MSNHPGIAGKSTRQMAKRRRDASLWIIIITLGIALLIYFVLQNKQSLGLGPWAVILLLIIVKILPGLVDRPLVRQRKAEKRAIRGAVAEEKVADLLAELDPLSFFVLHDIPNPYGNIDHIVIGKDSGVFLLETKAHGGRVEMMEDLLLVNGKTPEKDFIAQALKNSYWLRNEIEKITSRKIWITPVIVFTNAFVDVRKPIKNISVVNKKFLLSLLQRKTKTDTDFDVVWNARFEIQKRL